MNTLAALVQMDSGADKKANLEQAEVLISQAAREGAALVALPECFDLIAPGDPRAEAEPLGGPVTAFLSRQAACHGLWLLGGSFTEANGDALPYNTSTLWNPKGELVALYRKIHLYDVELSDGTKVKESARRSPGAEIVTAQTALGTLGLAVCYDLRFAELFLALRRRGAEILTLPANFTAHTGAAHWEPLLRARAIETGCFVLAPGQCGQKKAFHAWGHSLIVDPWGRILAQAGAEPQIVTAELNWEALVSARSQLSCMDHRRKDLYE